MKRFLLTLALAFCSLSSAQVTAVFPSRVATNQDVLIAANNAQSILAQPLTSISVSLQVISAATFKAPGVVTVDSEVIWVCSISGNTLYVCANGRGFDNSFAVFHSAGAKVSGMVTAYAINRHSAEIEAIETALGPNLSKVVLQSDAAYQATTTNVTEGTNLYFTAARAVAAMSGIYQSPITGAPATWPSFATVATSGNYGDLNNPPTIPGNTSQIAESGNLYFTAARAVAALAGLYQSPIAGAPGTWPSFVTVATSGSYNDLLNQPTIPAASNSMPLMDSAAAPGSSASYARANHVHPTDTSRQATITGAPGAWPTFATVATSGSYNDLLNQPTTTNISEGANLYFTSARAVAALSGLYQTPIAGAPATWPAFVTLPGITQGTCSSATPGVLNYSGHTAGVKDTVAICAADATDTWAWRSIY